MKASSSKKRSWEESFSRYLDIFITSSLDTGYQWGDRDWFTFRAKNPPYRRPMNIYECHLGSWRRTGEGTSGRPKSNTSVPHSLCSPFRGSAYS